MDSIFIFAIYAAPGTKRCRRLSQLQSPSQLLQLVPGTPAAPWSRRCIGCGSYSAQLRPRSRNPSLAA